MALAALVRPFRLLGGGLIVDKGYIAVSTSTAYIVNTVKYNSTDSECFTRLQRTVNKIFRCMYKIMRKWFYSKKYIF
jgi:hypothetical protein